MPKRLVLNGPYVVTQRLSYYAISLLLVVCKLEPKLLLVVHYVQIAFLYLVGVLIKVTIVSPMGQKKTAKPIDVLSLDTMSASICLFNFPKGFAQ